VNTKRPRILFISKWYINRRDPQLGVFIRKHAAAAALHCDVALLSIFPDEQQKNKIEFEGKDEYGIKTLIVYYKKSRWSLSNGIGYINAIFAGLKRIKQTFGDHDITHAYIMLRPALIAYWLKLTRGKPLVISEQWSGYATGKFSEKSYAEKALYRWVFKKADAVTAVSNFLKEKMIACGLKGDYTITNNIIEIKELSFKAHDGVSILLVADLVDDIKNVSDVIKVMKEVTEQHPEVKLNIIGHGRDELDLKNLASQLKLLNTIIFFHGVKTNEGWYSNDTQNDGRSKY
jgi:glycosyltransferase involved in cell wall biosynthesis